MSYGFYAVLPCADSGCSGKLAVRVPPGTRSKKEVKDFIDSFNNICCVCGGPLNTKPGKGDLSWGLKFPLNWGTA